MAFAAARKELVGYWGLPTSDADFCEPNYTTSHYVAEFWNTVSSIPIILVGVFGILHCRTQKLGLEQMLCYALVAIVGVGTLLFHATLMRTGQVGTRASSRLHHGPRTMHHSRITLAPPCSNSIAGSAANASCVRVRRYSTSCQCCGRCSL
jgi:hypothetical protein